MTATSPTPAKNFLEAIARFMQKMVKFVFKTLAAAALAGLFLIIIVPLALFTWRSTRPLNDPMFNGLSLYEVTLLRYNQYQEFTTQYNDTHPFPQYPGQKRLATPGLCFWSEIGYEISAFPVAALCSASRSCNGELPADTATMTPAGYLMATWINYEYALILGYNHAPQQQAAACRLPPTFPVQEPLPPGK